MNSLQHVRLAGRSPLAISSNRWLTARVDILVSIPTVCIPADEYDMDGLPFWTTSASRTFVLRNCGRISCMSSAWSWPVPTGYPDKECSRIWISKLGVCRVPRRSVETRISGNESNQWFLKPYGVQQPQVVFLRPTIRNLRKGTIPKMPLKHSIKSGMHTII